MKRHLSFSFLFFFSLILVAQPKTQYSQPEICNPKPEKQTILRQIEDWYANNMTYSAITALMAVESSFIPFPSEIVVPPAAYIASQPDSNLNIFFVVFFATIGALIGALINYFLAIYLGRPIIYKLAASKLGRFLLLSPEKIAKAEIYFNKKGNISTFIGRLIPGIRQLISIPAGLSKMNLGNFIFYTFLGAGIWNAVLALLGYLAHGQKNLIDKYSHELSIAMLIIITIIALFFIVKWMRKRKNNIHV